MSVYCSLIMRVLCSGHQRIFSNHDAQHNIFEITHLMFCMGMYAYGDLIHALIMLFMWKSTHVCLHFVILREMCSRVVWRNLQNDRIKHNCGNHIEQVNKLSLDSSGIHLYFLPLDCIVCNEIAFIILRMSVLYHVT